MNINAFTFFLLLKLDLPFSIQATTQVKSSI